MMKLSALLVALASFVSSSHAEEPPLSVGAVLHLTGDLAMQSAAMREGIELGAEEINAKGGALGRLLTVTFEDGANSPKASFASTQKLVTENQIDVMILSSYLDAMSGGRLLEREEIPTIVLWDSSPELEAAGDYIFSIGPWTPSAGEAAARFAADALRAKTAVIVKNADSWAEGVSVFFRESFEQHGAKVIAEELMGPSDTDFRAIFSRLKMLRPDVIYTPIVLNLVPFYSQLRQLQVGATVVTSDIIAEEHIRQAPAAFEAIYQTQLAAPDHAQFAQMARAYEKKLGKKVTLPWFVAVGYDSIQLIVDAARRKGTQREQIREGLASVTGFEGASTPRMTMTPGGSVPQYEQMFQIRGGKLISVEARQH